MRHMGKLKHVGKLSEVVVLSQYARDFWSKRSRSMSWPEITEFLFSETHKISQSALACVLFAKTGTWYDMPEFERLFH